jgi:hypothetical protein
MPAQRPARECEVVVSEPANPPMGRLDAVDVGSKKLTVQTEFFSRPAWRIETKIYLGGALKKVYAEDLAATPEPELQRRVDTFHQAKMEEIVSGLKRLSQ